MHRVFLDANVLFSAAYRHSSGLLRLWQLSDCELMSSHYAVEEARRNLETEEQRSRLESLVTRIHIVEDITDASLVPDVADLPGKDRPILASAMGHGADVLLTGDIQHFGRLFGQTIEGVRVMRPSQYLRQRESNSPS